MPSSGKSNHENSELIDSLAADLSPVDHRLVSRVLSGALAASIVAAIAAIWLFSGVRPDIKAPEAIAFLIVKLLFAGSVAATTFAGLLRLARPGNATGMSAFFLALPFGVIVLLAAISLFSMPDGHWAELVGHGSPGPLSIPVLALGPYALACTEDSLAFVACWYASMIVLCAILGALAGRRLLRW